jgi:hypothetical protein
MNERIVKLITEADAYAWTIAEKYVPECGEVNYLWEDAFRKKFAELIVRDCAEVALAKGRASPDTDFRTGSYVISEYLLARYGVE